MRIIRGERPGRPSHPKFTDNLWKLTQRCWIRAVEDRPKMEDVLKEPSAFLDSPDEFWLTELSVRFPVPC